MVREKEKEIEIFSFVAVVVVVVVAVTVVLAFAIAFVARMTTIVIVVSGEVFLTPRSSTITLPTRQR